MTTKSRQSIYGASVRPAAERAKEARKEAEAAKKKRPVKKTALVGLAAPAARQALTEHVAHAARIDSGWRKTSRGSQRALIRCKRG